MKIKKIILGILLLLFAISPVFAVVSDTTRKVRETGNGSKTAFDFNFKIFNKADLTVYKIDTSISPEVLNEQTLDVDYTVSINTITEGGTVTYTVAPTATEASFIVRELATDQSTDIPSEGVFPEKAIENALDKLAMNIIELEEESGRVAKLPINSTVTDLVYPDPEVGKVLFWETPTTLGNTSLVRVDSGTIEDRAIITSKLDDLAVTTPKIANEAITQAKIAADAVTFTEIAEDGAFGPFTGSWEFDSVNIDGGSIDGVTIGASSAPTVTNLGAVATVDINGGTIDGVVIGGSSAGNGTFTNLTANTTFKLGSTNQGDVLYDNGTSIVRLPPGTSGHFLKTNGATANPEWAKAGKSLGSWTTGVFNSSTQVTADSFLVAFARGFDIGGEGWIRVRTDSSNPPTKITSQDQVGSGNNRYGTIFTPVKKGDYYLVERESLDVTIPTIYIIPLE